MGGPRGLEKELSELGDTVTNPNGFEPELNTVDLKKGKLKIQVHQERWLLVYNRLRLDMRSHAQSELVQ